MYSIPFHLLPDTDLTRLNAVARDVIFREGDTTRGIFVCIDAAVHLVRVGPDGESITLHRAGPGQALAEASLFAERYHCDAVVKGSGQIVHVPKSVILAHLSDPGFANAYTKYMSQQVKQYRGLLEIMSIRSATERVYAALVAGLLDGTVMEFSTKIALTHEATYRSLRALVQQGRIDHIGRGRYSPKRQRNGP
jgi:CRP-like cAMP-binding protein